jgi:NodT family efflux transporter outer membrane factor (OMF) lipoprotein
MSRTSVLFAAVLGACAPSLGTVPVRDLPLPAAFEGGGAGPSAAAVDWRAYFSDDTLNALIAEALAGNLDLRIALQRIEIARAGARASTGALLPQVSAFTGGSLTRYGRYTPEGAGNASTEITRGRLTPNPVAEMAMGVQASWEADVWGRIRSLRGSARVQYLASVEGANVVITSLVAEVAIRYYELLALDHVRDFLRDTVARQTQALEMIRAQKEAGRANELAVQQFAAQLASTEALDAETVLQTREAENRLNVLLGRLPSPIKRAKDQLQRDVATTVATGVPSELLRNRPDIREAELHVEASRFDLVAARAAFYPSMTITADAGYRAFNPRFLLSTPESFVGSITGGLIGPLVNRRGIEAEFAAAKAMQVQAMYQYQSVVLTSFAEVATGLAALEQFAHVVALRRRKKAAVAGTVDAADALFRAGKANYFEVLLAQQNTVEAEIDLIEALRDQHVASVRIYKALGGGWRGELRARDRPAR